MATGSSVESPADLARPKGSNIDINIDFDKQGELESVKVGGELMPLEKDDKASNGEASGAGSEPPEDTSGFGDSIGQLTETSTALWQGFLDFLPTLFLAIGVLVAIVFLASAAKAGSRRLMSRGLRHSLSEVLSRFIYVLVWFIGSLVIAQLLFPAFELGTALTYLGVASLVLGFAFRDIFENAFAGLLILWRFPFENGDFIEIETDPPVSGQVHDIWVRSTLIREVSDELVVVPNAKIYQNAVRVTTWQQNSRQQVFVAVSYDTDLDQARDVLGDAVRSCDRVAENPPVQIFTHRFADSGVEFEVAWWAPSGPLEERRSRDQVVAAIRKALHAADIEIPYPYRTLTFKPDSPLYRAVNADAAAHAEDKAPAE